MKGYEEYAEIRTLSSQLESKRKSLLTTLKLDIQNRNLVADRLIDDIFSSSEMSPVSRELFEQASMRVALGNPPGKHKSLGDAINWLILKRDVPPGEDIHVISGDGDFYSALDEDLPHPFLVEEWERELGGKLSVYRTLSSFMKQNFDGVAFSFDKEKEGLIDALSESQSFASTHSIISKLESHAYFSLKEVIRILEAAVENGQFGAIVTDYDVSDFLNRVAVMHVGSITDKEQIEVIRTVANEQRDR